MTIPTLIYCAAGNKRFAEIAINRGFVYGAQLPNKVYYPPQFTDQNWKKPDREKYMLGISFWRPKLATVLDLETENQLDEVLDWAKEASLYVSEAVIIIPKVFGIIDKIPLSINGKEIRLGYSVPTTHGATSVPIWEFYNRPVHLLGGNPYKQIELCRYLDVKSADGNYAAKMAVNLRFAANGNARYAKNRFWPQLQESVYGCIEKDAPYLAFDLSCMNILAAWSGCKAAIRYAVESDLPHVKKNSGQYRNELGFVHLGALKEAIQKKELLVALYNQVIVGFCHFHKRKDGIHTIYELAVDKLHRSSLIGTGLFRSVPTPKRLKCTQDNPANSFYEKMGMKLIATENGKKRPLNVWSIE